MNIPVPDFDLNLLSNPKLDKTDALKLVNKKLFRSGDNQTIINTITPYLKRNDLTDEEFTSVAKYLPEFNRPNDKSSTGGEFPFELADKLLEKYPKKLIHVINDPEIDNYAKSDRLKDIISRRDEFHNTDDKDFDYDDLERCNKFYNDYPELLPGRVKLAQRIHYFSMNKDNHTFTLTPSQEKTLYNML